MRIDEPVKRFAEIYGIPKGQLEYLQLLTEGFTDDEIAEHKQVKKRSVKTVFERIAKRTNLYGTRVIMSEIYKIALGGTKQ